MEAGRRKVALHGLHHRGKRGHFGRHGAPAVYASVTLVHGVCPARLQRLSCQTLSSVVEAEVGEGGCCRDSADVLAAPCSGNERREVQR